MTKKYNLKDIRFSTNNDFGPSGILSQHSKLISIASNLSLSGIECFSLISDWFEHYPTNVSEKGLINNLNFKNSMLIDLKRKVEFETLFYKVDPETAHKTNHSTTAEINQLSLLLGK